MENYLKGEQRVEMLLQSRLITYPPLSGYVQVLRVGKLAFLEWVHVFSYP